MTHITEAERQIPIAGDYDVLICGGGPAGFIAAIAAARQGARTMLVERYGILGGTATAGLMVEFGSICDGDRVIVGGITHEFLHRLADHCGGDLRGESHALTFDVESMIAVCQEMVLEAGADLRLHSWVADAVAEDGVVTGAVVESKSGREAIRARVVVDATGDGDVAVRAGAGFRIGGDDGKLQPATLEIILGNVDTTRITYGHRELIPRIAQAAATGQWPIPTERLFSWGPVPRRGAPNDPTSMLFFINATNALGVDGTSAQSMTRGEVETRRQVEPLVDFLRANAPGFEKCHLHRTASQIGVRETRRIEGDYTLTREDVLSATHFDDGVVPACNSIDVHEVRGRDFEHEYLAEGTHYQIPYRCFLPAGLEGILVSGRCLSCDHRALGSARVMVVVMPMGEACGTAAAMAADRGSTPREVPASKLRHVLAAGGTLL